jgi:hypothetical protein
VSEPRYTISVYVSADERRAIEALAQTLDMRVNDLVKFALENQAKASGVALRIRRFERNPETGRPIGWHLSPATRRRISESKIRTHARRDRKTA